MSEPAARPAGPSGGRIEFIHIARACAALAVVWAHLGPYFLASADRGWVGLTVWRRAVADPLRLYQDGGHLAVVVFFLVSGYVITHASLRETRTEFFVKRVARILPMLVLALVAAALSLWAARELLGLDSLPGHFGADVGDYLETLALLSWVPGHAYALAPVWTLSVEVGFYVLAGLCMGVDRRSVGRGTWTLVAAWLAVSLVLLALPSAGSIRHVGIYIAFLLVGRVIYLVHTARVPLGHGLTVVAAVLLAFTVLHLRAEPGVLLTPGYEPLVSYALALLIFLALLQAAPTRTPAPLRLVGDVSYSLYLLHMPVGFLLLFALDRLAVPFTLGLPVTLAAVLGVSTLTHRFVERPAQTAARRLLARRRAGAGTPGGIEVGVPVPAEVVGLPAAARTDS